MNTFRQILGGLLLLVMVTGCVKKTNELGTLEVENFKLKQQLGILQNENKDEQLAIFQYITFVDSIDKVLNNVFVDFISIQNSESKYKYEKKQVLLNKLNSLVDKLDRNQSKINELEKNISKQNSQYKKEYDLIVQALKKERLQQIEKITNLQHQIENLIAKVELQENQIKEQSTQIQEQKEIIYSQNLELEKVEIAIKKKYVVLVSRKVTKKIEIKGSYIVIPKKSRKIKVEISDKEYCKMVDLVNNQTKFFVDDSYWRNSNILTLRIIGRL